MNLDLEMFLMKFKSLDDHEYKGALYKTKVPAIGSLAYLNIIFLPLKEIDKQYAISQLNMPDNLLQFYSKYNGAHLFLGNISIYGFHLKNQLLDYADFHRAYPHNILDENLRMKKDLESRKLFHYACYRLDNSMVCIKRLTGEIICFEGENFRKTRATWSSFQEWISQEIVRISDYFDEFGNPLLMQESQTLFIKETLPSMSIS